MIISFISLTFLFLQSSIRNSFKKKKPSVAQDFLVGKNMSRTDVFHWPAAKKPGLEANWDP
jgi:hypothetical protein